MNNCHWTSAGFLSGFLVESVSVAVKLLYVEVFSTCQDKFVLTSNFFPGHSLGDQIQDEVPCGRTVVFLARISLYLDLRDTIFSHSWSRIDNIWAILDNISSFLSSSLVLYLSVQTESVRIILGLQDYTAIGLWRSIYGNYGTRKQSVKKRQRQNLAFVSSFYYFWIMSITAIVWCKTISVYL